MTGSRIKASTSWARKSEAVLKLPARPVRLLGVLIAVFALCGQAAASSRYVLIAEPPIVHPGDTIYLSGSGYPPNTPLTIVSICNDSTQNPKNRITVGSAGPTTNGAGQFVGVPFQLPTLPDSGLQCKYYPSFSSQDSSPVVPAYQDIDPSSRTIEQYNRVPFVYFYPKQSGKEWVLHLSTWPGSHLRVEVQYFPSYKKQHINRTLGWSGAMTLTAPKGAFAGKGTHRALTVTGTSTFRGLQGTVDSCQRLKPSSYSANCI